MNRKTLTRSFWVALLMIPIVGRVAQSQTRYPLRHPIAAGDRNLTESASEVSLKLTARLGDQAAPVSEASTRLQEKYVEEVLAARGNRVTRLRQQYRVARTFTTDPAGNQMDEPSSLQGQTFTIERKGSKVVISPARAKISAEDRKRLLQSLDHVRLPFLPDRAAAIGEEWPITASQIRGVFPQARTGTMKARFEEVTPYAGRQCAHLRLSGELELAVEGVPAPIKAQLTGDLYHALGIQRPVSLEVAGPLTVNTEIEQGGRRLNLTGEGRMTAKLSVQWQRVAGKPVAGPKTSAKQSAASGAGRKPGVSADRKAVTSLAKPNLVRFGEVSFQLPGPGWKVIQYNREARRIVVGLPGEGQMRGVTIWPVEVPLSERNRSRSEHAAAYFDFERQMERPDGPWTGFQEGERSIGGHRYPTMSYQFHPHVSAKHVMDGLFLVYFPPDFEQRQRFYVLMWSDLRTKDTKAHDLEELDAVVRSLQIL